MQELRGTRPHGRPDRRERHRGTGQRRGGRVRSDRVMRPPKPPRMHGVNGRPPKHGPEFRFTRPETWPEPSASTLSSGAAHSATRAPHRSSSSTSMMRPASCPRVAFAQFPSPDSRSTLFVGAGIGLFCGAPQAGHRKCPPRAHRRHRAEGRARRGPRSLSHVARGHTPGGTVRHPVTVPSTMGITRDATAHADTRRI
ncbi:MULTISPECIES: transposase [Streptomyces]|uniref:transposase n=1 Tax=Streptomyces TaxID=1883 RepID=UPI0035714955